jgi:RNA polymerase sigma factor (sigma-70 family)
VSTTAGKIAAGIRAAEARSAGAPPGPARSAAAVTHSPGQQRRIEPASRGHGSPRTSADPVRDGLVVTDLVTRARTGDKQAWDTLVERYAPLIWSICCRYQLGADAEDISQSVWLRLVGQLGKIRDPAALAGWLATTTRRECLRLLGAARGPLAEGFVVDADAVPDERVRTAVEELLVAERHAALREAFGDLPPGDQQLILLLIGDPPVPYAEISARLGIPVGSIGPTRRRCLDKLRRHPAIAALIDTDSGAA